VLVLVLLWTPTPVEPISGTDRVTPVHLW